MTIQWLPGMRSPLTPDDLRWHCTGQTRDGQPAGYWFIPGTGEAASDYCLAPDGLHPDLDDPATHGCIAAQVRAATGATIRLCDAIPSCAGSRPAVVVYAAGTSRIFEGDTLGAALLAALDAAEDVHHG